MRKIHIVYEMRGIKLKVLLSKISSNSIRIPSGGENYILQRYLYQHSKSQFLESALEFRKF